MGNSWLLCWLFTGFLTHDKDKNKELAWWGAVKQHQCNTAKLSARTKPGSETLRHVRKLWMWVMPIYLHVQCFVWEVMGLPVWQVMGLPVWEVMGLPVWQVMGLTVWEVMGLPVWEVMGLHVCEVMGLPVWQVIGLPVWQVMGLHVWQVMSLPGCLYLTLWSTLALLLNFHFYECIWWNCTDVKSNGK